jgi:hypothetical protein
VVNNAKITSATGITLKADGAINLNDVSLDAPTINLFAGTTFSHNLGTIFDYTKSSLNSLKITRGTPNASGILTADVRVLDASFSIRDVQTDPKLFISVDDFVKIEAVYVPAPSTLALLLGVLALGLSQRFRRSI